MRRKNNLLLIMAGLLLVMTIVIVFRNCGSPADSSGGGLENAGQVRSAAGPGESPTVNPPDAPEPAAPDEIRSVSGRSVPNEDPHLAGIAGYVLDSLRQPLPNMVVEIIPAACVGLPQQFFTTLKALTDKNGYYGFKGLSPDRYLFLCGDIRETMALQAGQTLLRDVVLTGTGGLSGVVTGTDNRRIFPAAVYLIGPQLRFVTQVNESGRFELHGIQPAEYQLFARADGFIPSTRTELKLLDREQKTGLVVTLTAGALLTGNVRDDKGQPVPGVRVSTPPDPARFGTQNAVADATGYFEMDGLNPGPQPLQVWAEGSYQRSGPTVNIALDRDNYVEIVLSGTARVTGTVELAGGGDLPEDLSVVGQAGGAREERAFRCYPDRDGRFKLAYLEPGSYQFSLQTGNPKLLLPAKKVLDLEEGDDVAVTFRMERGASVSGAVQDPQGKPLRGCKLTLVIKQSDGTQVRKTQESDERGQFQYASLPAGLASLSGNLPGFFPFRKDDFRLGVGQDLTIPVQLDQGGQVEGIVQDDSGPVTGVLVFIRPFGDASFQNVSQMTTDASGHYLISGLDRGQYVVCAVCKHPRIPGKTVNYTRQIVLEDFKRPVRVDFTVKAFRSAPGVR